MAIENELQKDLFRKIKEYLIGLLKMEEMEEATGLDFDSAFDMLIDSNPEYQALSDKTAALRSDINQIFIQIKGYPLTISKETQMKLLDIVSDHIEENISQKELNKYFEIQLLTQNDDISQRANHIKGLYLQGHLNNRTYSLYNEAMNCYIYGFYNASCVLCRTISELMAKSYLQHRGYGDLLCGKEKDKKHYTIPGLLSEASVPKKILQLYRNIHSKADKIIHRIDEKTSQGEALKTIKELQELIKDFPKCI